MAKLLAMAFEAFSREAQAPVQEACAVPHKDEGAGGGEAYDCVCEVSGGNIGWRHYEVRW